MRVVVVGRMPEEPNPRRAPIRGTIADFQNACRQIGWSLTRHGHTLVVTSDRPFTADKAAVEGYVEAIRNGHGPAPRIELVSAALRSGETLFEDSRKRDPGLFVPISIHTYSSEVARLRISMEAEATFLFCGASGTERTGYVALAANRKLVPLASFGGAASTVLTEMRAGRFGNESLPRELDMGVLSQDWSDSLAEHIDAWLCDEGGQRDLFVVYGRNRAAQLSVFAFLRALDLNPLEWDELVHATGKGAPYVGEILALGFARAQACVVLFTGDELARLRPELARDGEDTVAPQPRPNVLFEAGMALAHHPDRTVIVKIGDTRALSDLAGRHYVELDDSEASRLRFARRLEATGCAVSLDGEWRTAGDFGGAVRGAPTDIHLA